jgi:hypothetical protein
MTALARYNTSPAARLRFCEDCGYCPRGVKNGTRTKLLNKHLREKGHKEHR